VCVSGRDVMTAGGALERKFSPLGIQHQSGRPTKSEGDL
jgi:hypothetical protein